MDEKTHAQRVAECGSHPSPSDPGDHFRVTVDGPEGPRERHYVDANIHSEELRRKVMASAAAPARKATLAHRRNPRLPDSGLRIGYAFWGFLGDHKLGADGEPVSTPDGNAAYSWSIIWELMQRGHRVLPMMPDRDIPGARQFGHANFSAFAKPFRVPAYSHLVECDEAFGSTTDTPELDLLLLEWRFPVPGRNTFDARGRPGFQPDLDRQEQLLRRYLESGTKVVAWDLDLKLTEEDERRWPMDLVLETSVAPVQQVIPRRRIEPPVVTDVLLEHPTCRATTLLTYVGSRYERDDVIDEWIRPIANRDGARGHIHFYGNWLRELAEVQSRWPGVAFHDRVPAADHLSVTRSSAGVPLLAKAEYRRRGFVTPRVWEAILFGSVPIGLGGHTGVGQYAAHVARDAGHLLDLSRELMALSVVERAAVRREAAERVAFMDARHFADTLEGLCG